MSTAPRPGEGDLSMAQRAALAHVREIALSARDAAREQIATALARAHVTDEATALIAGVAAIGRVTLNFHPDRMLADGRTVAAAMLEDGRYRNQFETRISNGSRTAYPGGNRDRWEERLFGGAYHAPGVRDHERPKYGALDLLGHADGAAPRFGSCFLRLRAEASARATFCFGDSHLGPSALGTLDAFEPVLAALLVSTALQGTALGRAPMDLPSLTRLLLAPPTAASLELAAHGRALDDYIEAQVHGEVLLARDAELLVADPSFRGTETESDLRAIAERHRVPLAFHPGFELGFDEVPEDFRGPAIPPLARRLGRELAGAGARLDAALVGRGAASLHREPAHWQDGDTPDETLQHLKQLWHVLVRFGRPASAPPERESAMDQSTINNDGARGGLDHARSAP